MHSGINSRKQNTIDSPAILTVKFVTHFPKKMQTFPSEILIYYYCCTFQFLSVALYYFIKRAANKFNIDRSMISFGFLESVRKIYGMGWQVIPQLLGANASYHVSSVFILIFRKCKYAKVVNPEVLFVRVYGIFQVYNS